MGMTEFRNGTFGEFTPMADYLKQIENVMNTQEVLGNEVKAFHFGTKPELEEIKSKADLQSQIDMLSEKVEKIAPKQSFYIHLPTPDEIRKFSKEEIKKVIVK